MKVIMIRHGIAEDRDPGKEDALRELTAKGRRQLEDNAFYLVSYLQHENVRLISSPLCRALQTAAIFSQAGLAEAEVMDFIATGDPMELRKTILADPLRTCVIVGHSPYLEDWVYQMTQQTLSLEKGAALEIEVTDTSELTGLVKWVLPLKKFDRLVSFDSIKRQQAQFAEDIRQVITGSIDQILDYREIYLREPEEIESVHKLRVKIRQFRSLISFFKPLMSRKQQKSIQNVLRAMAQECAYLRELDVLTKEWQKAEAEFVHAGISGQAFLALLGSERKSEERRLFGYLEKPEFARLLKETEEEILRSIQPERSHFFDLNTMVRITLRQWHLEIRAGYEAIAENDLTVIHALRIRAKKMRYLMEIFSLNEIPASKEMYKQIKTWQEVLGDLTDANRNSEAVNEIAQKFPQEPIQAEIELFNQIQARRALMLYQEFFGQPADQASLESQDEDNEPPAAVDQAKEAQPERATPTGD